MILPFTCYQQLTVLIFATFADNDQPFTFAQSSFENFSITIPITVQIKKRGISPFLEISKAKGDKKACKLTEGWFLQIFFLISG